jgi:hypothetical protein
MKKTYTILILLFFIPTFGFSCSCGAMNNVRNALKNSDVVLVGKIINLERFLPSTNDNSLLNYFSYTVLIQKLYKGKIKTKNLIVTSTGDNCRYPFKIGEEYIIYATYFARSENTKKQLFTSICDRTARINKDEIAELTRYKRPKKIF